MSFLFTCLAFGISFSGPVQISEHARVLFLSQFSTVEDYSAINLSCLSYSVSYFSKTFRWQIMNKYRFQLHFCCLNSIGRSVIASQRLLQLKAVPIAQIVHQAPADSYCDNLNFLIKQAYANKHRRTFNQLVVIWNAFC